MYALIYWLFMLCLPLFLGDSSYSRRDKLYLELLQCQGLFSALRTYLLVTLTQTLATPGPIQ